MDKNSYEVILRFSNRITRDVFFNEIHENKEPDIRIFENHDELYALDPYVITLIAAVGTGAATTIGKEAMTGIIAYLKKFISSAKLSKEEKIEIEILISDKKFLLIYHPDTKTHTIEEIKSEE